MTSPVQIFPLWGVSEEEHSSEEVIPLPEHYCEGCGVYDSDLCPVCGFCENCCKVYEQEKAALTVGNIDFRCLGCDNSPEDCTCSDEDVVCQQCREPYLPGHSLYCETCLGDLA